MRLPLGLVNLVLRVGVRGPLSRIATPQDLRHRFERDAKLLLRPERGARFEAVELPGGAGPIQALWTEASAPREERVILYLHGGAYLVGSPQTHRAIAAALAKEAGARALLPDYRLAPEHPFPAAVEDALAAYRWLLERYPAHRIALAGESAGGGLLFATLLAAQTEGLAMPAAAAAFSPFADMTLSGESYRRNARREVMLPSERAEEAVGYYLQGADPADPLASPAHGTFK
ncbi:MAG: alpha/beta hydrolase fold domain-containing protein, partial [Pseudomonadota bacterium]